MESNRQLTAVLLDPRRVWRETLGSVLERLRIDVLATGQSPEAVLQLIETHAPDLLLVEGGVDEVTEAIECVRRARSVHRDLHAIVLSSRDEPELVDAALAAGASAYVTSTTHADDIAAAIRQVFDPSVYLPAREGGATPPPPPPPGKLTRREQEILQLVSEGRSNSEVAKTLWVTEPTVKFHLSNIYRKLDVSNRTEAARWAQLHGLLDETRRASRGAG